MTPLQSIPGSERPRDSRPKIESNFGVCEAAINDLETVQSFFATAKGIMGSGRMVGLNAAGEVVYADNVLGIRCVGFLRAACLAGDLVRVETRGRLNGLSGMTPSANQWLGANGLLTPTPPVSGALQRLGYATTADTLQFDPTEPITLS